MRYAGFECQFSLYFAVSEEMVTKNIAAMAKSLKQLEIDLKNAQNDKNPPSNDEFVETMSISFTQK